MFDLDYRVKPEYDTKGKVKPEYDMKGIYVTFWRQTGKTNLRDKICTNLTVLSVVRLGLDKKDDVTQTESESWFERIGKCNFF